MDLLELASSSRSCWLGLACVALLIGCDKAHEGESPVERAGSGGSENTAGTSAGSGGAGRAGSTAGASGRGAAGAAGSQPGASGTGGKPAGAAGSTTGGAGKAGSAAGSGSAGTPAAGSGGSNAGGKRCGTRGGVQCGADQFCNFEPDVDCGATDRGGVCEAKTQTCRDIYLPVCGCDNRTYSSDCSAHGAGVSVKREGLCNPEECEAAGGRAEYSDGASIPECEPGEASWMISGGKEQVICCLPGKVAGKTCGGIAALKCDAGQYCSYEDSATGLGCGEGIADAAGTCEEAPKACTRDLRPVCSCDRHSYNNPCEAHAAGVSVLHDGACTESDCTMIGGRVAYGLGPAPKCNSGETEHGYVVGNNGSMPIEGALCCLP